MLVSNILFTTKKFNIKILNSTRSSSNGKKNVIFEYKKLFHQINNVFVVCRYAKFQHKKCRKKQQATMVFDIIDT